MTDQDAAPKSILKFVRCKCKVTVSGCSTNRCTCKKNGLHCVSACGNCQGQDCANIEKVSNSDSEDEDRNIFEILREI